MLDSCSLAETSKSISIPASGLRVGDIDSGEATGLVLPDGWSYVCAHG